MEKLPSLLLYGQTQFVPNQKKSVESIDQGKENELLSSRQIVPIL